MSCGRTVSPSEALTDWENRNINRTETRSLNRLGKQKQKETETDWEHRNRNLNKKHWFGCFCVRNEFGEDTEI